MLKYIAIVAFLLGGYYFWNKQKSHATAAALPPLPQVKVAIRKQATRKPVLEPTPTSVAAQVPVDLGANKKEFTYPEIQQLIVNNDICALQKLIADIGSKNEDLIYIDAFLEATGLRELKEMIGINSPMFKAPNANSKSPEVLFIDAMATSGLMYNSKREKNDPEKSLAQLDQLSQAFPSNAAYALFKLGVENQLGKPKSHLRETAKGIKTAQVFNSIIPEYRAKILSHRWDSPALNYLANHVAVGLPAIRAARSSENGDLFDDSEISEHLGNLLVQKGLASDKLSISEDYDNYEYYYGNSLLDNKHPNITELNEIKHPGKMQEIEDNWVGYDLDPVDCDPTSYMEHFEKLKGRF